MKSTVIIYRKINEYLAYPFMFLSAFIIVTGILPFINAGDCLGLICSVLFPFYVVYNVNKSAEKGIICAFCTLCGDIIYFGFTSSHFSILFCLIISIVMSKLSDGMRLSYLSAVLFITVVALSVVFGLINPLITEYLKAFSSLIKGKGFLFGMINNAYMLGVSDKFSYLFYHTDFGSSTLSGGKILSGAIDIFKYAPDNSAVSQYLTGKYFVNIFLTLGLLFALFKRLSLNSRLALVSVCAAGILTGDVRCISLFILIFNPFIYLAYLFVIGVSYLIPELLGLKIGFTESGSISELVRYGNSWIYFIVTGAVLTLLMYFSCRLVMAEFSLSDGNYYPPRVRKIISCLGGEENITDVKRGRVTVSNPNLINIISLDCDIHGNMVILDKEDFELIEEYF